LERSSSDGLCVVDQRPGCEQLDAVGTPPPGEDERHEPEPRSKTDIKRIRARSWIVTCPCSSAHAHGLERMLPGFMTEFNGPAVASVIASTERQISTSVLEQFASVVT
jgi:hypothetical protein